MTIFFIDLFYCCMQITFSPSVSFHKSYTRSAQSPDVRQFQARKLARISPVILQACYFKNLPLNYQYRPISSLEADFELLECDYEDIEEFSESFAQKINSQLLTISEKDIKNLISRIKLKTGANEKIIKDVLFELTQFANYDSLKSIEEMANKEEILEFGLNFSTPGRKPIDFSTNACLNYLGNSKHLFKLDGSYNYGLVLDDFSLKQLESFKNSSPDKRAIYDRFIKCLSIGRMKIFNIKGWDIKCSDNKYRSANMFQGSGYLENLAVETIKQLQRGKNLDEILYSDLDERLKNIIKDDINPDSIEIVHHSNDKPKTEISTMDILKNLSPKKISKEKIEEVLEYFLQKSQSDELSNCEMISAFSKYLDEQTIVYSIDSMAKEFIELHEKIKKSAKSSNINENEIFFQINETENSHVLATYMYAKANGIDFDHIICKPNVLYETNEETQPKTGVTVILDDISASGDTQSNDWNILLRQRRYTTNKTPIYLATLVNTLYAEKNLNKEINQGNILSNHTIKDFGFTDSLEKVCNNTRANPKHKEEFKKACEKYCYNNFELLSPKEFDFLYKSLTKGFRNNNLSCVFPYMIPDNCSDLSAVLFDALLHKSNIHTNKPLCDFENDSIDTLKSHLEFLKNINE